MSSHQPSPASDDLAAVRAFAALLTRARGGDTEAMGTLINEHADVVDAFAKRKIRDGVSARLSLSDIRQSVARGAIVDFSKFQGTTIGEFRQWVAAIGRSTTQDYLRRHLSEKRDLRREVAEDGGSTTGSGASLFDEVRSSMTASRVLIQQEDRQLFEEVFAGLTERDQQLVELQVREGLTLRDMVERLGGDPESLTERDRIKKRAQRAKAVLQARLWSRLRRN